jgi:hypothetical protein
VLTDWYVCRWAGNPGYGGDLKRRIDAEVRRIKGDPALQARVKEMVAAARLEAEKPDQKLPQLIEALGGDTQAFYRKLLRDGKGQPLRRSKLMLVGPGRAGKTSLVRLTARRVMLCDDVLSIFRLIWCSAIFCTA